MPDKKPFIGRRAHGDVILGCSWRPRARRIRPRAATGPRRSAAVVPGSVRSRGAGSVSPSLASASVDETRGVIEPSVGSALRSGHDQLRSIEAWVVSTEPARRMSGAQIRHPGGINRIRYECPYRIPRRHGSRPRRKRGTFVIHTRHRGPESYTEYSGGRAVTKTSRMSSYSAIAGPDRKQAGLLGRFVYAVNAFIEFGSRRYGPASRVPIMRLKLSIRTSPLSDRAGPGL